MASLFFCYSHKDEALRDRLETALAMLKREGIIESWHDRRIVVGTDWANAIDEKIESADMVLLLTSPDFLASDYCYGVEMARALERHASGSTKVVPVILRPCEWERSPLGKLQAAPTGGVAVTKWPDPDDAFLDIAKLVRTALTSAGPKAEGAGFVSKAIGTVTHTSPASPRSSNLRLAKKFTDADLDAFKDEAFEYMARFFENSLRELQARNPQITTNFKRVDAEEFIAKIYRDGEALSECRISIASDRALGNGITYSGSLSMGRNSFNESMSVEANDQTMYLKPIGFAGIFSGGDRQSHFEMEGASEFYWDMFIRPVQSS